MQEDRNISIQQVRDGLREVEKRFEQWQQNYLECLYHVEKLRVQREHLRRLTHHLEISEWNSK